jgi:Mn2+/Fe2+ NRAMP family transporter
MSSYPKKAGVQPDAAGHTPAHSWAANLGAGLATTGSDNDPSGIATYSLAGAQFGYDMLWTCVLTYPSMVALQLVSAHIAALTGKGLTENLREREAPPFFYLVVARFTLANTLNIATNMVAMGVAARLLWSGSAVLFTVSGGMASVALQWFFPYARYAAVLKWLTVILFAYVGVVIVTEVPWASIAARSLIPQFEWSRAFLGMLLAVLGTTLSPYLLFAQAEQEVEALHEQAATRTAAGATRMRERHFRKTRIQTSLRTAYSNAIAFFIIVAAAGTLHVAGAPILTVSDAAHVLSPLAHRFAPQVLGLALIGTALLALPPLAGSAAHAAASGFGWPRGASRDRRISLTLVALMVLGMAAAVSLLALHVEPVHILYWSALFNGTTVTPIMVLLILFGAAKPVVGEMRAHWALRSLCWLATGSMGAILVAWLTCEVLA